MTLTLRHTFLGFGFRQESWQISLPFLRVDIESTHKFCMFIFVPKFFAGTQNSSMSDVDFDEYLLLSQHGFVIEDEDEMLMCPVRAI